MNNGRAVPCPATDRPPLPHARSLHGGAVQAVRLRHHHLRFLPGAASSPPPVVELLCLCQMPVVGCRLNARPLTAAAASPGCRRAIVWVPRGPASRARRPNVQVRGKEGATVGRQARPVAGLRSRPPAPHTVCLLLQSARIQPMSAIGASTITSWMTPACASRWRLERRHGSRWTRHELPVADYGASLPS